MTGRVLDFPQQNPERDKRGRMVLKKGQRWMEKKIPHRPWIISFVEESDMVDDKRDLWVHLEDIKGRPAESCFTEEVFRRRYRFVGDANLETNQKATQSTRVNNLKHWACSPIVSSKKD